MLHTQEGEFRPTDSAVWHRKKPRLSVGKSSLILLARRRQHHTTGCEDGPFGPSAKHHSRTRSLREPLRFHCPNAVDSLQQG